MVIRRLRRKFVFTNMCVIFLMLTAIFVAVLLFTSGRLAGDSERSMRMLMDMNPHSEFPQPFVEIGPPMEEGERDDKHRIFSSSFLVETDLDGNVTEVLAMSTSRTTMFLTILSRFAFPLRRRRGFCGNITCDILYAGMIPEPGSSFPTVPVKSM